MLRYAPAGFDATLDKWTTRGVYARIKLLDHLPRKYTRTRRLSCDIRRPLSGRMLPKAEYWDVLPEAQTEQTAPLRVLDFLAKANAAVR